MKSWKNANVLRTKRVTLSFFPVGKNSSQNRIAREEQSANNRSVHNDWLVKFNCESNASSSDFSSPLGKAEIVRDRSVRRLTEELFAVLSGNIRAFSLLQYFFHVWHVRWNGGADAYRLFDLIFHSYRHHRRFKLASFYSIRFSFCGRHCCWLHYRQVTQVVVFLLIYGLFMRKDQLFSIWKADWTHR